MDKCVQYDVMSVAFGEIGKKEGKHGIEEHICEDILSSLPHSLLALLKKSKVEYASVSKEKSKDGKVDLIFEEDDDGIDVT